MNNFKAITAVILSLAFSNSYSQNKSLDKYLDKYNLTKIELKSSFKSTSLNIPEYSKYNLPIEQERLSTRGLYGYEVPTVYTEPGYFAEGKFSLNYFAEWYVDDDEEYPKGTPIELQEKLDREYLDKYGEKKYWYTIYNGAYLDYYPNKNVTLTFQADMYPYSPKIYFPDHFGFWFYFTYNF